jgi:O-antigen/teichoic acid export membrane protein
MRHAFNRLLETLGIERGLNTKAFIDGLIAIGPFFIVAKSLTFGIQMIAGRLMGPEEFGITNVIVAVGSILFVLLQLSFPVLVAKFAPMESSRNGQANVISSALWLQLAWFAVMCILLYLLRIPLSDMLKVSHKVYAWGLFYASFMALGTFTMSSLKGLMLFNKRGMVEFVYALVAGIAFIPMYYFISPSFRSYIMALISGLIIAIVFSLFYMRSWIKFELNISSIFSVKSYIIAPFLNNILGTMLATVSPLLLAYFMSAQEVGIFSVYRLGSLIVAGVISSILGTVIFPMTASPALQYGAWQRFLKLNVPILIAGFVIFPLTSSLVLFIVADAYPFRFLWILLFSLSASLRVLFVSGSTLLYAMSAEGYWSGMIGNVLAGLTSVGLGFLLIPRYGLTGAATSLACSYGIGTVWCSFYGWKTAVCNGAHA